MLLQVLLGLVSMGNIISFGLFVSPAPTFWRIIKHSDVEQLSPNLYLATVLNCAVRVFYGMPFVHPHNILVITINGIGLPIQFGYIFIYCKYANRKQRMFVVQVLGIEAGFMAVVIAVTLSVFHTTSSRSLVVGVCCVVFNICMYAMPLDAMRLVIRTKSVEYMPFNLSLANFLNGCIWVGYAQIRFDLFVTINNGTGAFLGLIQLILYATYYWSTPKKKEDKPQPQGQQTPEVQLSDGDGKVSLSMV